MAKHKKKKNKKKNKPLALDNSLQTINQINESRVESIVKKEATNRPTIRLKKNLLKVAFVTILILIIIAVIYIIKNSTGWYSQISENIYNWLQLGRLR